MARKYGKVSPKVWTGKLGAAMRGNAVSQALALYLVTSPHTNMIGLFRLPFAYATNDLGHSESVLKKAMTTLTTALYCDYDAATERVWVREHLRHELSDKPLKERDKRLKGILRELDENAVSPLAEKLAGYYRLEWAAKPLASPIEAPSPQEQEQGTGNKSREQEQDSSEPQAASEPAVLIFDTVGKSKTWPLFQNRIDALQEAFPHLDVMAECRIAKQWCYDNDRNRKTPDGMPKFLFGWMGRTQNRGGGRQKGEDGRENARQALEEIRNGQ